MENIQYIYIHPFIVYLSISLSLLFPSLCQSLSFFLSPSISISFSIHPSVIYLLLSLSLLKPSAVSEECERLCLISPSAVCLTGLLGVPHPLSSLIAHYLCVSVLTVSFTASKTGPGSQL